MEKKAETRRSSRITKRLKQIELSIGRGRMPSYKNGFIIKKAENAGEMEGVHRLTHDTYFEQEYIDRQPGGKLIHYPHLENIPETTVLIAVSEGRIIGTNSLTLDGPAGLHVDKDFKEQCDRIRLEGRSLAASWRIATRSGCRSERKVVLGLIQKTVDEAVACGIETMVFTFNPRHERIYRRLLNMRTVARSEGSAGLNNAPAVFMRLDREDLPEQWLKKTGRDTAKETVSAVS